MGEFIFMRPWWLLALLGLIPLAIFWRSFVAHKTWENYISAGPSFSKIPQPVQQNRDAVVVLFDLSPSMLAADIAPNRLTRARLKLIDLLRSRTEGRPRQQHRSGLCDGTEASAKRGS